MNTDTRAETTVLDLIDGVVAATPERPAVQGTDGTLTYGELSARADQVACLLSERGVNPGDLVALCLERSTALVVAALGVFRVGGAYVATDPAYPDERLAWMLADSAPAAIVAGQGWAPGFADTGQTIALADGGRTSDPDPARGAAGAAHRLTPGDLAYVVYTSGSSGRPKGAMADHKGLLNLVEWHRAAFGLTSADRCTQIASPGFDAAVWEIWPTLAAGACLHVVPESLRRDPIGLRDWLVNERITVSFLPTAVVEGLIGLTWPNQLHLRHVLTGGDALTRRPDPGLGFSLVNNYGLSEATVVATSGVVTADGDGAPSIGRAIDGVLVEIVDDDLAPVEPGAAGELVIGGAALGPGYLNNPDLTAERFVEDPQGRRLYRTGDSARFRADGEIEFLGRLDDQLSIRGFRVEAGEVAAALNGHPAVAASVAVAVGDSSAERQLVAYVVAVGNDRPDGEALSEFVGRSLPEYMVPSRYVWLEQLPVTAHGKIDRKALPDPGGPGRAAPAPTPGRPAETELEAAIASVVAELLEVPAVGVDQNFFLLGGHSMLGAQLIVRLEDLYGVEIGLRYLFDHPTPADLATEVERQIDAGAQPTPPIVPTAGTAS